MKKILLLFSLTFLIGANLIVAHDSPQTLKNKSLADTIKYLESHKKISTLILTNKKIGDKE